MKGPLSYVGGKNRLANQIIALIPKHKTYVEAFAGGAQVMFRKEPSAVEVINDLDGELVNFYRVCQAHHEELLRSLEFVLLSRKWYERLSKTPPESLTDIQRAARYFIIQKCSFGGMVARHNFAAHITKQPTFTPKRIPEMISSAYKRLQNVQIENLPFEKVLEKYDRPTTFFYLDPPYYGVKLYNHNFSDENFLSLKRCLSNLKGKFLLSINDHPFIRKLFAEFKIEKVGIFYSLQKHAGRRYSELLIRNY
ncbi:MAG: restriction endonuclease subunit M [Candidatus Angelobacter sp. Gp1-AA117]|nr:MAG: restriction endonuclease subunit M [Candidatus Angelobacter sp. Gp1-AA117]